MGVWPLNPKTKRMQRHHLSLLLVSIFLLSGCVLFPGSEETILVRTNQEIYAVDEHTTLSLTVTNNLDTVIYYICTGQVYLEELNNGAVVDFWQVHGFEECLGPGPIEPGERHLFDIRLDISYLQASEQMPRMDETVSYRMRADLFHDNRFQNPVSLAVSNQFNLVRAE